MRAQLISWLQHDIAPAVRASKNPEAEILKLASEKNLAPALVEGLGQLYNTAATVSFLDKSANRGASFHIVDVPKLVSDYLEVRPKAATLGPQEDAKEFSLWEDTNQLGDVSRLPRCFAGFGDLPMTGKHNEDHTVKFASGPSEKALLREEAEHDKLVKQAEQARFDFEEDMKDSLTALRRDFRAPDAPTFQALERDALHLHGDAVKAACDVAAQWIADAGVLVVRATDAGERRLVRETPALAKVAQVMELLEHRGLVDEWLKSAAPSPSRAAQRGANQSFSPRVTDNEQVRKTRIFTSDTPGASGPRGRDSLPTNTGDAIEWGDQQANDGLGQLDKGLSGVSSWVDEKAAPLQDFLGSKIKDIINERSNKTQQAVDTGASEAQRMAVLQNLLHTDEVLSEADPEHVVSVFNSISKASPELARDINVMRVALRSAVQHDGITPFDIKQFMDVESADQKKEIDRRKLRDNSYKGVSLAGPEKK